MSIQTDLTRIKNAKAAIKAAIEGKGVTVPSGTLLDGMAALIESIEAGAANGIVYTSGTLTFTSSTQCEDYVITHSLGVTPQIFIMCIQYAKYSTNYALQTFGVISEGIRNLGYKAQNFAYFYANTGVGSYYRMTVEPNKPIAIDEATITLPVVNNSVFISGLKYCWHAIGGIEA